MYDSLVTAYLSDLLLAVLDHGLDMLGVVGVVHLIHLPLLGLQELLPDLLADQDVDCGLSVRVPDVVEIVSARAVDAVLDEPGEVPLSRSG